LFIFAIPKLLLSKFVDTIFFLDEAYFEFSGITVAHEVECYDNLFVSRTFSKAFGIANFRAGYLISSKENITNMSLVRNAKNISTFTQEAMIGVLSDLEYMRSYVEEVKNARSWIISEIRKFDFIKTVFESQANFILVEFFEYDVKLDVLNNLERNKIYVRNLTHSDILKNCLRITVGLKSQMIRVVNSFKQEDV
jgi:histidinol-phosphate aminotransferase